MKMLNTKGQFLTSEGLEKSKALPHPWISYFLDATVLFHLSKNINHALNFHWFGIRSLSCMNWEENGLLKYQWFSNMFYFGPYKVLEFKWLITSSTSNAEHCRANS